MAEGEIGGEKKETEKRIVHTYPLVRNSDMNEEMRTESVEIVVTACEKHSANNEMAARMIKEQMDKKFGPPFHVVVGEGFGFEITYECKSLLYMYFAGTLAICMWKA
ncbi:hypothetical protein PPYR_12427 [Photinus pyralis]|uniref:Dynein light chain n=1 Tax=Photinus pyralis TaxID=7054 RepID=A0A5N4AED0_PHOPY|nr:dynein light chain 4, axonemal [Photinus pyralis]KAB0795588.1 hypothetical protein PPYR_12427 [Photinus pyralis]